MEPSFLDGNTGWLSRFAQNWRAFTDRGCLRRNTGSTLVYSLTLWGKVRYLLPSPTSQNAIIRNFRIWPAKLPASRTRKSIRHWPACGPALWPSARFRGMVEDTDFRKGNNEDELHNLLKESPWLINPTYFEFLASNLTNRTLYRRLEKHLQIGEHVPEKYDKNTPAEREPLQENRRPDLVFLLGSESLHRLVIVELKAPNTPLLHKHLLQLGDYMRGAEEFLASHTGQSVSVEGRLIGTLDLTLHSNEIYRLRSDIEDRGPTTKWQVFDLIMLFERTCNAHREFLEVHKDDFHD